MGQELGPHRLGLEQEIPAVPQIALVDIALCGCWIRLFDETVDFERRGAGDSRSAPDVAEAGVRPARRDAKCHDVALAGRLSRRNTGGHEGGRVRHDMVGGHDQRHRVRIPPSDEFDRHSNGCRRVSPLWLKYNVCIDADDLKLLRGDETHVIGGDHDRPSEYSRVSDPLHRRLEGRQRADQRHELFGHGFTRGRPKPGTRPAAHDHRYDGRHSRPLCIDQRALPDRIGREFQGLD